MLPENYTLRFTLLSLLIYISIISIGQQSDSIRKMPALQLARTRVIDIKHINIVLRFNWKIRQAYGTTAITFSPLQETNKITLDAVMMSINNITLTNGTILKFNYDPADKNDGLEIILDRMYQKNENLTIKINYKTNWVNLTDPNNLGGSNGKGIRFFEPTTMEPNRRKQIWSAGEPESNRYWFPCYDAPDDLRTTEFTATVDKNLTAISNGTLVETKMNSDGSKSFHWMMDTPYVNHLTSFVIGEYVDVKQENNFTQLHSFGYSDERKAVEASVVRLPDILQFFSNATGLKYPYASYSQVFVQDIPNWIGNSSTATITENMIDDYGTHADFFYLWDQTEGEALAHQWFGSFISCRDWKDIWLSKGFARYFSSLYDEHKNGRDEFLLYQHQFDLNTYLGDWSSDIRHPVVTKNYADALSFCSDNYPYYHGANVLHMLRKHLGDENWWKAIRLYVKSNAGKLVTTKDFQNAVETITGESMQWFFDQWIYKMGHPVFEVTKNYDGTRNELTLTVKQIQKIDSANGYPQTDFFQGKMEIEIDGKVESIWIKPMTENGFTFSVEQEPKLVSFDYESTWIKEMVFNKSCDELLYQLQNDKDILGKQWALNELVVVAKDEITSPDDKSKIYAGLRNIVLSPAYWRIRYKALQQLQGLLVTARDKPAQLDEITISMLLATIKNEKSWNRAAAINFLGLTRNIKFADIYVVALNDKSDRVINAAAVALGRCKSHKAFDALSKLVSKPSWKNQSLISALNGLRELGDKRGFDIAYKALADLNLARWSLPTPVWDFRITAAQTIASLGKSAVAYPLIFDRFKKSLNDNDLNCIFNNVLLITTLADPRGQEVFNLLRIKFKNDNNVMMAVEQYETQFKNALRNN